MTNINDQRKITKSKHSIQMITIGGKLFYRATIPNLKFKDEFKSKNFSSPFRIDKKPSCCIYLDKSTNKWLFTDFGDSSICGDIFNYSARRYGLDVRKNFPKIIEKMWEELKIDELDQNKIARLLEGTCTSETQIFNLKISSISSDKFYEEEDDEEAERIVQKIELDIIEEADLGEMHKQFLINTGIKYSTMKMYNSFFIRSYNLLYDESRFGESEKKTVSHKAIWICYRFHNFCKIYSPNPKRFWFIGSRPKRIPYCFGTPNVHPEFEGIEIVILTAGEKDALSLLSREYNAMCVNSETSSLSRSDHKAWLYDCKYRVLVIYDLDETGISQAQKLKKDAGFPYVILPNWLREKGGKDITDFFALGGTKEELDKLIGEALKSKINSEDTELKLLPVRTAAQRLNDAKSQPDILPHADVLFQTNELTIFFGDTGKGKSIFAVALADAISKGIPFLGLENKCQPLRVIYYDFELSDKQFEKRYTNENGMPYVFSDQFYIDNIDLSAIDLSNKKIPFDEILIEKIKSDIRAITANVLIIDNITFLTTYSPEDGQVAMRLMKLLKELKTEESISIMVLAHTPKKFGLGGISLPDLAGSKHLSNFCDSVSALGVSKKDTNLRYIIQVKPSRTGEVKYDAQNVIICEIQKIDSLLTFVLKGFAKEDEHLFTNSKEAEEEMIEKAKELQRQGKTYREIADDLGVSKSTVGRWLKPIDSNEK